MEYRAYRIYPESELFSCRPLNARKGNYGILRMRSMIESTSGADMDRLPGISVVQLPVVGGVATTPSLGLTGCDEGCHEAHLGSMSASQRHPFGVRTVLLGLVEGALPC